MRVSRKGASSGPIRAVGLTAAATQLALAIALGGLASQAVGFPNPPEPVPRPIALALLYALPAVVGALGTLRGRGWLLGAAAAATAAGALLAFSEVTLIFLVPALLFAVAAVRRSDGGMSRENWSVARVALFVSVAIPAAFVAIVTWGIYVVIVLALLAFIVQLGRAAAGMSALAQLSRLTTGLVVAGLMIGAGVVLFANTETRCWTFHETDDGVEYRETPVTDTFTGGVGDQVGGACHGGVLTPRGAALASVFAVGAIGAAAWASRD